MQGFRTPAGGSRRGDSLRAAQRGRLSRLTFFLDENFGASFAEAVRRSGHDVVLLRETFDAGIADEVWLKHTADKQYIALTKDKGVRSNPLLLRTVLQTRARVVVFAVGEATGARLAELAEQAVPKIIRSVGPRRSGCIFKVTLSGAVAEHRIPKRVRKRLLSSR